MFGRSGSCSCVNWARAGAAMQAAIEPAAPTSPTVWRFMIHLPRSGTRPKGAASGAPDRKPVQEALEIQHVQRGDNGRAVAVGVRIARGELVQEADEIVDVRSEEYTSELQ